MFSYQVFYLWKKGCTTSQLCDSEHFLCGSWVINTSLGPFHFCYSSLWPFKDTQRGASHTLCKRPKSQSQLIPWYIEHLPIAKRPPPKSPPCRDLSWAALQTVQASKKVNLQQESIGKTSFQNCSYILKSRCIVLQFVQIIQAPTITLRTCQANFQPFHQPSPFLIIDTCGIAAISCYLTLRSWDRSVRCQYFFVLMLYIISLSRNMTRDASQRLAITIETQLCS